MKLARVRIFPRRTLAKVGSNLKGKGQNRKFGLVWGSRKGKGYWGPIRVEHSMKWKSNFKINTAKKWQHYTTCRYVGKRKAGPILEYFKASGEFCWQLLIPHLANFQSSCYFYINGTGVSTQPATIQADARDKEPWLSRFFILCTNVYYCKGFTYPKSLMVFFPSIENLMM